MTLTHHPNISLLRTALRELDRLKDHDLERFQDADEYNAEELGAMSADYITAVDKWLQSPVEDEAEPTDTGNGAQEFHYAEMRGWANG